MSNRRDAETGWSILSYLVAGLLMYGGLGWLGDHFLHTRFLTPLGIIVGSVLSLYIVVKKFGQGHVAVEKSPTEGPTPHGEESQ